MRKIDILRDKIASFSGREFVPGELPRCASLYSSLAKMEQDGEIRFIRYAETKGRPCKVYVEGKLRPVRKNAGAKLHIEQTPLPNWGKVWPEFFTAPNFVARGVTNINRWSKCHD